MNINKAQPTMDEHIQINPPKLIFGGRVAMPPAAMQPAKLPARRMPAHRPPFAYALRIPRPVRTGRGTTDPA